MNFLELIKINALIFKETRSVVEKERLDNEAALIIFDGEQGFEES